MPGHPKQRHNPQRDKKELIDPLLAVAALGLSPDQLEKGLKIFECMFRDLKVYSQALGTAINYYHDNYNPGTDAVLHLDEGRNALIEFKLGSFEIEEGAKHLNAIVSLAKKYETEIQCQNRLPNHLWIITGGKMSYTREGGVKVIPIGCLKD